eukprot:CAMPEP_0170459256 /NCGR_PEP_ID=MMETSP0123-20130129/6014_1 /TAXON_ID=182087 /ORGANISM="Favella ehrenbergii, Strain Fehren 1" /LENGTH=43 /DNA_ID= /DNA_START= /DNA_END= /DNA_ORIENTATION=
MDEQYAENCIRHIAVQNLSKLALEERSGVDEHFSATESATIRQ